MPIKQCNAITIHKAQGATFNEKVILNCHNIFEKNQCFIQHCQEYQNLKIRK